MPSIICLASRARSRSAANRSPIRLVAALVFAVLTSSGALAGSAAAAGPPVNTAPPTISGSAVDGQVLTEHPGSWDPAGTSYTYHWQRCDTSGGNCATTESTPAFSAPTSTTYMLTAPDIGRTIRVQEIAKDKAGTATAVSVSTAGVAVGSQTQLTVLPAPPVTNQPVTLIATVTASSGDAPPSGVVDFKSGDRDISGCASVAVLPTGQAVTVTCQTSFAASTVQLRAVFIPGATSHLEPSSSAAQSLTILRDTTSTSVDVSKTNYVGESTTYTATVAPPAARPGPIEPSGSVQFFDGADPIPSCLSRPLVAGGATCTVTYGGRGTHSITARYGGDANFDGSASPAASTTVTRRPIHALGSITATMQWMFHYTPAYTTVLALVVNGAAGDKVSLKCHGRGCPYVKRSTSVRRIRRCGKTPTTRACRARGTLTLTPPFRGHRLRVGTRIAVTITRTGWIGKYYSFTIRAGRIPRIRIDCLAPGGARPGRGC